MKLLIALALCAIGCATSASNDQLFTSEPTDIAQAGTSDASGGSAGVIGVAGVGGLSIAGATATGGASAGSAGVAGGGTSGGQGGAGTAGTIGMAGSAGIGGGSAGLGGQASGGAAGSATGGASGSATGGAAADAGAGAANFDVQYHAACYGTNPPNIPLGFDPNVFGWQPPAGYLENIPVGGRIIAACGYGAPTNPDRTGDWCLWECQDPALCAKFGPPNFHGATIDNESAWGPPRCDCFVDPQSSGLGRYGGSPECAMPSQ